MVNSKEILARLQNGEDADAIAKELVNALNEAKSAYNAEIAANKEKITDMEKILDSIYSFLIKYYCDDEKDAQIINNVFDNLDAKRAIETIEEMGSVMIELDQQLKDLDKMFKVDTKSEKAKIKAPNTADAVINDFLKSIGL